MQDLKAELVRGLWYVALLGADLRAGRMVHKTLLGEPVLIGRGRDGRVFALRDICPHRCITAASTATPSPAATMVGASTWAAAASRFHRCARARRSTSPRSVAAPIRAWSGRAWCGFISPART